MPTKIRRDGVLGHIYFGMNYNNCFVVDVRYNITEAMVIRRQQPLCDENATASVTFSMCV